MFVNMNFSGFETHDFQFVTILGNQIVENVLLPGIFAKSRFIQAMQQIFKDNRPIQIQCIKQEITEDTDRILKNKLVFSNNAFIRAFGETICQI